MRRVRYALVAAVPMLAIVAARVYFGYCYPGCVVWDDSDPEWYMFFCYLCAMVS